MVVLFSMLAGNKEIPCAVSTSVMDELEGVVHARTGQREEQLMRLRECIEACAAVKGPEGQAASAVRVDFSIKILKVREPFDGEAVLVLLTFDVSFHKIL
jgi:hypothetical protein